MEKIYRVEGKNFYEKEGEDYIFFGTNEGMHIERHNWDYFIGEGSANIKVTQTTFSLLMLYALGVKITDMIDDFIEWHFVTLLKEKKIYGWEDFLIEVDEKHYEDFIYFDEKEVIDELIGDGLYAQKDFIR